MNSVKSVSVGRFRQFVETPIFTRRIRDLLSDDSYRMLQNALLLQPEMGAVVRGTGGARKVRWATEEAGKRGGIRVIYFLDEMGGTCYMLFAFRKNERDSLTAEQTRQLKDLIRNELKAPMSRS